MGIKNKKNTKIQKNRKHPLGKSFYVRIFFIIWLDLVDILLTQKEEIILSHAQGYKHIPQCDSLSF